MGSLIAAFPCATSVSQLYTQPKMVRFALMFMDNSLGRILSVKKDSNFFVFFFLQEEHHNEKKTNTPTIFEGEVRKRLPLFETHFLEHYSFSELSFENYSHVFFSVTVPILAGRSRFAALSRLQTGITWTQKIVHPFLYIF